MARFLRRALAFLAGVFLFVVTAAVVTLAVILYRPEWIVNSENLRWALGTFAPELRLSFDDFDLRVESESFWRKRLDVSGQNLCLDMDRPHLIHFCSARTEINLVLDFGGFRLRLGEPPRVHVEDAVLAVTLKPGPPARDEDPLPRIPEPTFRGIFGPYRDLIPSEIWGDIAVELREFDLRLSEGLTLRGQLEVANAENPKVLNGAADLEVFLSDRRIPVDLAAILDLESEILRAQVRAPDFHAVAADVELTENLKVDAHAKISGRTARIDLDSVLVAGPREATLESSAKVHLARPHFLKSRKIPLPQIDLRQRGKVKYQFTDAAYDFDAETEISSPSFSGIAIEARGAAGFRYARGLNWRDGLDPRALDLRVAVADLQRLAREIRWTLLQIPAPFYRMRGPLELTLQAERADPRDALIRGRFTTDLDDGLQAMKLELGAEIRAWDILKDTRRIEADADLQVHKLILELPRLSPLGLPRFTLDSRIQKPGLAPIDADQAANEPVKPPLLPWKLDLRLRTPEAPIILRSNLVSDPIPLKLDQKIRVGSNTKFSLTGQAQVLPMTVELFRRKIQVNRINVDRAPTAVTSLDGLFSYTTSEVEVRIRLLGTTESPQVVWESDPPLTQRQIISIIVFGKSLNELTQEETSSAQNLERAFADGALGVASLFLLASTPIESVSYDPISKTYAARLKVDGRTSLSLGSDFEDKQSLALRRQLGGAWSIKTELQSTTEQKDQLSTFLEWFKRF